jgi:hypothetical protein
MYSFQGSIFILTKIAPTYNLPNEEVQLSVYVALYMLSDFPGTKNLNDLNSLNNLSGLNDLHSLISPKKLYFKVKINIFDCYILFIN